MAHARIADAALALRHVFVRDLVLRGRVGVHAHERDREQRIRVNLDLGVRDPDAPMSRPAAGHDDLARVVDYEGLAEGVRRLVAGGHINLVETLAERIAEHCLMDERVVSARVCVEKLDVFPDAVSAGVEVERRR